MRPRVARIWLVEPAAAKLLATELPRERMERVGLLFPNVRWWDAATDAPRRVVPILRGKLPLLVVTEREVQQRLLPGGLPLLVGRLEQLYWLRHLQSDQTACHLYFKQLWRKCVSGGANQELHCVPVSCSLFCSFLFTVIVKPRSIGIFVRNKPFSPLPHSSG